MRASFLAAGCSSPTREGTPVSTQPPDDPSGEAGDGNVTMAISREMVALMKDYFGRGPTKARTYMRDNLIVVIMEDTMTKAELTLVRSGNIREVRDLRRLFQETIRNGRRRARPASQRAPCRRLHERSRHRARRRRRDLRPRRSHRRRRVGNGPRIAGWEAPGLLYRSSGPPRTARCAEARSRSMDTWVSRPTTVASMTATNGTSPRCPMAEAQVVCRTPVRRGGQTRPRT